MSHTNTDYVIVGKIGAAYGIKGWLKVISFTDPVANILDYHPWYLEEGQSWKLIPNKEGRTHGKGMVAHIAGIDNPEQARQLTGKTIAVLRSQLPALKKDEYYWAELEGLTVINQKDEVLGKIIYLIETGTNDVLIIKGDKEHAIPYLPGDVVTNIDMTNRVMHVNWDLI